MISTSGKDSYSNINNIYQVYSDSIVNRNTLNGMDQFEAIGVVEYRGIISSTGESQGHYTCDIKYPHSQMWYRTNDSSIPILIQPKNVSKYPYVVLYKKC